jgi:penicillin-binding protein 1C
VTRAVTGAVTAVGTARRWRGRRVWRTLLAACALGAIALAIAVLRPYDRRRLERGAGVTVVDRDGQVLRRSGEAAQWTPLERISPALVAATLASEDHRFWNHHGVDPVGLARALWLDLGRHRAAFGASTVSMQLVRLVDPAPHTLWHKLGQAIDALRIERALSKREILEQYLNRAYYGHRAVGAEAAAQLYFGKAASMLSLGEAALLAAIPRAPGIYDPIGHLDATLARRAHILALVEKRGLYPPAAIRMAAAEPIAPGLRRQPFLAPHFCDHVLAEAGPAARGVLRTTLDASLQARLEDAVRQHLATLEAQHVSNAGLVVLENATGAVRALVGSADWFDAEHNGAVDIALAQRSPGSTLKPILYALAIERGDAPSSIAFDVARDEPGLRHAHDADFRERGPVRYRDALGSSLNLAALDVLSRHVHLPALVDRLAAAGILPDGRDLGEACGRVTALTSFACRSAGRDLAGGDASAYHPGLVLGAVRVRPLDLAAAFAAFAQDGSFRPWHDREGEVRPTRRLFSPEVAWLVGDMLADPAARRPVFGEELPLDLPFRVMAKTGTSAGFADNLTVAATREWTVLAWAGNFDGSPMHGVLAMRGAAPLARAAFLVLRERGPLSLPERPAGIVEAVVCPLSGLRPSPGCPARKRDYFRADAVPEAPCTWHQADGSVRWPAELAGWAARLRPAALAKAR